MTDKERADRAEACCAEMRDYIIIRSQLSQEEDFRIMSHALSTDCGTGWLSPEKAQKLEADRDFADKCASEFGKEVEDLEDKNKLLVEALEFAARSYDDSQSSIELTHMLYDVSCVAKKALSAVKGSHD